MDRLRTLCFWICIFIIAVFFQLKSTDIQTLIILLGKKIDEFLPLESTARVYSKNRFRIIFRKWK